MTYSYMSQSKQIGKEQDATHDMAYTECTAYQNKIKQKAAQINLKLILNPP